jgi:hypothetical protein
VAELAVDAPGRRQRQGAGGACGMAWSTRKSTHGKICDALDSWEKRRRRREPRHAGCVGKQQGRRRHARARYRLYTRCTAGGRHGRGQAPGAVLELQIVVPFTSFI